MTIEEQYEAAITAALQEMRSREAARQRYRWTVIISLTSLAVVSAFFVLRDLVN